MGKPNQTVTIKTAEIRPNQVALRSVDKQSEAYSNLVDSIRENGLLSAPTVRKQRDGSYELIDGLHRFTALQDLGIEEVTVILTDLDDDQVLVAQIITNIQRIETKPVEYSKQLLRILTRHPLMTEAELAVKLGRSPVWVKERLGLTKINDANIASLIDEGKITLSNAYALAKLPTEDQQDFLSRAMTMEPSEFVPAVNVRVKELKDAKAKGTDAAPAEFVPIPHVQTAGALKAAVKDTELAAKVVAENGAQTPVDGFLAGIAWAVSLDKASVEAQRSKDEARRKDAEEAKARRAAEREAKKQADAKAALAKLG